MPKMMMQNQQHKTNLAKTTSNQYVDKLNWDDMIAQYQEKLNYMYNSKRSAVIKSQVHNNDYNSSMKENTQYMTNNADTMSNQFSDRTNLVDLTSQLQQNVNIYNSSQVEVMTSQVDRSDYNSPTMLNVQPFTNNTSAMPSKYVDRATRTNMERTSRNQPKYHPCNKSKQPAQLNTHFHNHGYKTLIMPNGQFGTNNACMTSSMSPERIGGASRGQT